MKGKQKVLNLDELVHLFGIIKQYDWTEPLQIEYKPWEESRGISQNALAHVWYREAAKQLGDRHIWEVAGECKLDYAVPLLLGENQEYQNLYDLCLKPYDRETQINILGQGYVLCTRLLTKKQFTEYLNGIQNFYGKNGIHLMAQGEYEDIMMERYS